MESKEILIIVLVSAIVAVIVSLIAAGFSNKNVAESPTRSVDTNLPDLIITNINTSSSCQINSTCIVPWTASVQNMGNRMAGDNIIQIRLDWAGGTGYIMNNPVPSISPGESVIISNQFNNVISGNYLLTAKIDESNQIKESDENNNFYNGGQIDVS